MYIPRHFLEEDPDRLFALMESHGFATLVTVEDGVPFATHLPLLVARGEGGQARLIGHMARANPQWRGFSEEREVLAIFHGPHAYVSPRHYVTEPNVPTWSYAVVHAYGLPRLIEEPAEVLRIMEATGEKYEAGAERPWRPSSVEAHVHKLMPGTVGFELRALRLEGKFKLGQNRKPEDRKSSLEALERSPHAGDRELAALMRSRGE
ncbi:FMN-binding negative transcriptional regulator [Myxococcaceae bacterium GXIMD 01537]